MNHGTSEQNGIALVGECIVKVTRYDGTVEEKVVKNIVTRYGLNRLAARALANTSSPAGNIAVGTVTAVASLDSDVADFGEVGRKVAATTVQSQDWFALTCTFAGNADGLTGVVLGSVVITDHPNSGSGAAWNIANSLGVTLGASDFLNVTPRIRVGSHNLGHST